jgi:hypothetical protein
MSSLSIYVRLKEARYFSEIALDFGFFCSIIILAISLAIELILQKKFQDLDSKFEVQKGNIKWLNIGALVLAIVMTLLVKIYVYKTRKGK